MSSFIPLWSDRISYFDFLESVKTCLRNKMWFDLESSTSAENGIPQNRSGNSIDFWEVPFSMSLIPCLSFKYFVKMNCLFINVIHGSHPLLSCLSNCASVFYCFIKQCSVHRCSKLLDPPDGISWIWSSFISSNFCSKFTLLDIRIAPPTCFLHSICLEYLFLSFHHKAWLVFAPKVYFFIDKK